MQSYWYNNQGKTHPKYKFNQICFVYDEDRYLHKKNQWYKAPISKDKIEPQFEAMDKNTNPIEDMVNEINQKKYLQKTFYNYLNFSSKIEPPSKNH
jgi:hypothetical protein